MARRVGTNAKRVNVDFPAWMVDSQSAGCLQTLTTALATRLAVPAISAPAD
jgi:hypothetical protein